MIWRVWRVWRVWRAWRAWRAWRIRPVRIRRLGFESLRARLVSRAFRLVSGGVFAVPVCRDYAVTLEMALLSAASARGDEARPTNGGPAATKGCLSTVA